MNPMIEPLEGRVLMAGPADEFSQRLTRGDVQRILANAGSQAMGTQIIAVVDREGNVLGVLGASDAALNSKKVATPIDIGSVTGAKAPVPQRTLLGAITRARTAAFFQSTEDAFTTRTARFIIQDHFPHPVPNTPGGPLYGVQFSSFRGSDTLRDEQSGFPALSGDPGGVPIYKNGIKAGGIGVAGDGEDIAARTELFPVGIFGSNPDFKFFQGKEESDFDEAVALAGTPGFEAPKRIRATKIFVDGLRFPYL